MPTFGSVLEAGTYEVLAENEKRACRFYCPEDFASFVHMYVWLKGTGIHTVTFAVYEDGDGEPAGLSSDGSATQVTSFGASPSEGWIEDTFSPGPGLVSGTWYWLTVHDEEGGMSTLYNEGDGEQQSAIDELPLDDPWVFGETLAKDRVMSIYVEYLSSTGTAQPSGVSSVAAVGDATGHASVAGAPDGQSAVGALGTSVGRASDTVAPDGVAAVGAVGTALAYSGRRSRPQGVAAILARGTATPRAGAVVALSGGSVTSALGDAIGRGGAVASPDGAPAVGVVGSSTAHAASAYVSATGVASLAGVGSSIGRGGATAAGSVASAAALGMAVAYGSDRAAPAGAAIVGAVGVAVALGSAVAAPSGVSLTAAIGDALAYWPATPAGVAVAGALGTTTATGAATASPAGVAVACAVNSLFTPDATYTLLVEAEHRTIRPLLEARSTRLAAESRVSGRGMV